MLQLTSHSKVKLNNKTSQPQSASMSLFPIQIENPLIKISSFPLYNVRNVRSDKTPTYTANLSRNNSHSRTITSSDSKTEQILTSTMREVYSKKAIPVTADRISKEKLQLRTKTRAPNVLNNRASFSSFL